MKYLKARRSPRPHTSWQTERPISFPWALDFGYGSHEAFTRAFRDHFGQTPEQVRKRRNLDGLAVTPPLRLRRAPARSPVPRSSTLGRLKLAGLPMLCSYNETIQIPAQWQRFMSAIDEDIPRKLEQMPIGMCEPPDDDGCFKYVCAAQVEAFGERIDRLTYVEVEARTYGRFMRTMATSPPSSTLTRRSGMKHCLRWHGGWPMAPFWSFTEMILIPIPDLADSRSGSLWRTARSHETCRKPIAQRR